MNNNSIICPFIDECLYRNLRSNASKSVCKNEELWGHCCEYQWKEKDLNSRIFTQEILNKYGE